MIKQIKQLLDDGRPMVSLIVTAVDDILTVTLAPKPKVGEPTELSTPLQVRGTVEELEDGSLADAIEKYGAIITETGNNLSEIEAKMKQAVASKSKSAMPAKSVTAAKPTATPAEPEIDKDIKPIVGGTVADGRSQTASSKDVEALKKALDYEQKNKNRGSLIDSIRQRIEALDTASAPAKSDDPQITAAREILGQNVASVIKWAYDCKDVELMKIVLAEEKASASAARVAVTTFVEAKIARIGASAAPVAKPNPEPQPIEADDLDIDLEGIDELLS